MGDSGWGGTEQEHRIIGLLVWLSEQSNGFVNAGDFYEQQPSRTHQVLGDIQLLADRGLVDAAIGGGGIGALEVSLTGSGSQEAAKYRAEQQRRRPREWACRSAAVAWLDELDAVGSLAKSTTWSGFTQHSLAQYYGTRFSGDDVDAAAAWLKRNGLIEGVTVAEMDGPVRSFLTDKGQDCVENYDSDVRAYLADMQQRGRQQPTVSVHVGGNVSGNMQIAGRNGTQTINVTSSLEGLTLAIQGISQIVRDLGYAEGQEAELQQVTKDAIDELGSEASDLSALRHFGQWVIGCAEQGGQAAIIAAVTLVTSGALQSAEQILGLPGGGGGH